jgi:hypothetical protein
MYIQRCIKGIAGQLHGGDGITEVETQQIVNNANGIISNWWRKAGTISPAMIATVLTDHNLDRHLHDYDAYRYDTPFISLACGSVERDALVKSNFVYSAVDTALMFATEDWMRPGALFFCWVPTSQNRAVAISTVSEPVRDLNIYQRWSPFQLEGEITAKVNIPANQIEKVEWWDGTYSKKSPKFMWPNSDYVDPEPLSNIRNLF